MTSSSTCCIRRGTREGSVCLYEERQPLLLAGDVLFAGTYGRTDLPGGNDEQMAASLARLAREIPPGSASCPGTAPETTIGRELPWLRRIAESGRLIRLTSGGAVVRGSRMGRCSR